ncbi:MAG: DUF120 domain-containing protein [Dermatophilaceae bacterium]
MGGAGGWPPLHGTVVTGVGEAAGFVTVPWVREKLRAWLGAEPYPGTLNLRIEDPADRATWQALASRGPCLTLPAGQEGFCDSSYLPVVLDARLPGGVVRPHLPGYPADVLEVVAPVNLRAALRVRDGDVVSVAVSTTGAGS